MIARVRYVDFVPAHMFIKTPRLLGTLRLICNKFRNTMLYKTWQYAFFWVKLNF